MFFLKKSVDKMPKMEYIIYIVYMQRGEQNQMQEQKRTTLRAFLLTNEEDAQLKKDAYAHEMNTSEYLRWLISKERKKMNKDKKG